ncbi:MAG TPA: histidine kinase [Caulobacteraceae bacterium]|nr:histidine kinase [Caulobacteraceae bacterium]
MSLRTRVLLLIGLVLLAGVVIGSAFAGFEAKRALQAELAAGMSGGAQTVRSAFEDLPRSDHPERDLRQLVATFDGNRHVRAVLTAPTGAVLASSRMFEAPAKVPRWFARALGPPPAAVTLPAPAGGAAVLRLEPISSLDIGAYWREFAVVVSALSASAAVGLAMVYFAIGAALRPLSDLSAAFVSLGAGRYDSRVRVRTLGPSELVDLEQGFNRMADQLVAMNARNRLLEGQLLTVQEEERADIARDLHDEIGPHLFAVTVDAQMIGQAAQAGAPADIPERVRAIQTSVAHMQRLVRDILGRLRPTPATELGLNAALTDLAAFWQTRRPDVSFDLDLLADEAPLSALQKDTVYRIVQEGVSNALRHANPSRVTVSVRTDPGGHVTAEITDNGTGPSRPPGVGLGLIGMRERVSASGGVLTIDRGEGRAGGWSILARLPLEGVERTAVEGARQL